MRGNFPPRHPHPRRNCHDHRRHRCHRSEPSYPCCRRSGMAHSSWTHCMYCHAMICGVEVLDEYPDIVVLYAHTACHEERGPMDPDALWQMMLENLRILHEDPHNRDKRENVIANLRYLINWLHAGGFPPTLG